LRRGSLLNGVEIASPIKLARNDDILEVDMCLGIPGKIIEIDDSAELLMAKVDFGGIVREACLEYIPEAKVGDYTVIHVGFAISLLSEEEAQESLAMLREIVDLEEELGGE
jgi:hydrogenase expression/formation protein HypC